MYLRVDVRDAVDVDVEVRRRAVLGLVEVTVGNDVGLGLEVAHVVDVGQVLGERLAADSPGGGIEDLELAGSKLGLNLSQLFGGAGSVMAYSM